MFKNLKRLCLAFAVCSTLFANTVLANTGWFQFDLNNSKSWYYFTNGILLMNRLTPDGYYVGHDGKIVENNINSEKYSAESAGTKILVFSKSAHRVELWNNGTLEVSYPAASGKVQGDKELDGDCKTPLGTFYICRKIPNSQYTRGLLINYPANEDAERGLASGLIDYRTYLAIVSANNAGLVPPQNTVLGSEIEFHGNGQTCDATRGCIGLRDADILDLYNRVPQGCRVDIIA